MKLISERLMVLGAPEEWRRLHLLPSGEWRGAAKAEAYRQLMALDLNAASIHDVNEIMGFKFLKPAPPCDFCGEQRDAVIVMTLRAGWQCNICQVCAARALEALTEYPVPTHTPIPLPVDPILIPYDDGGTAVLRFHGVVGVEPNPHDHSYPEVPYIGPHSVIESIEEAREEFRGPVTVAIADERFDGDLWADSGSPGYSEWTPGTPADLTIGPHNLLEVLERYNGQVITMWVANGPFNVLGNGAGDEEE